MDDISLSICHRNDITTSKFIHTQLYPQVKIQKQIVGSKSALNYILYIRLVQVQNINTGILYWFGHCMNIQHNHVVTLSMEETLHNLILDIQDHVSYCNGIIVPILKQEPYFQFVFKTYCPSRVVHVVQSVNKKVFIENNKCVKII